MFAGRENTRWYSWTEVEETAYLLDIPTVPVLYKGIFKTEQELKDKVLEIQNTIQVFDDKGNNQLLNGFILKY